MPVYSTAPSTEKAWKKISDDFFSLWNFPHCVGAIDGKHVVIQAPPSCGSEFYNYKGTHSIILMAICDVNYCFTLVDIGDNGHHSDGGVFVNSSLGQALESNQLQLPSPVPIPRSITTTPYTFVGDAAFPLKTYLQRPYPGRNLDDTKRIFNYRLSRARRTIENTFGILAARLQQLLKPLAVFIIF